MKLRKSNLDEQQELRLLQIESRGFWLAFWGNLIVLLVQILMMADARTILCQFVLFTGLALYMTISCVRAGIWDRRLEMNRKNFFLLSLLAGLCAGAFDFGFIFLHSQRPLVALAVGAATVLFTFVLCYLILLLTARATKKRQDSLNAEPEEEGVAL